MPELPEVEIASRQLRAWLDGHRIVAARAARSRVIRGQAPQRFASLAGRRLVRIQRLGKWMLLEFDRGEGLISHLGMTGKWIRRAQEEPAPPHVRASIALDDGHVLDYRDPRLFGRLIRGRAAELRELPALRALGPDPLEGIDLDRLHAVLQGTRRSMKEALMDQRTLAGLGNIHVSESLFRARIDPQRPGVSMTREEVERLADCIVDSLRSTLLGGGRPRAHHLRGGGRRERLSRLRSRRAALSELPHPHPPHRARRPQHLLLSVVPAALAQAFGAADGSRAEHCPRRPGPPAAAQGCARPQAPRRGQRPLACAPALGLAASALCVCPPSGPSPT